MKRNYFIFLVLGIVCLIKVNAQNPVTTLQHNGITQVYYGQNSFSDALGAAVNGDTLVLSAGFFTAPTFISKGVKVYGSGHFPDSANVPKRTTIMSGLSINAGADSLRLEGLFINGDINYDANNSINYVSVIRCRLGSALFHSTSATASKNNCSYEECFIEGGINFFNYGNNLLIKHCIISGSVIWGYYYYNTASIVNIGSSGMVEGNIIISLSAYLFYNVHSSLIKNNIFYTGGSHSCDANSFNNNIFLLQSDAVSFSNNSSNNNYFGVPQSSIFVNQTGNTIDYTHNYHLQNPSQYLGTDGTQVGIYGGTTPFKEKGTPSNPQITHRNIATQTDVNGNLQINISGKAQDR